MEYSLNEQLEVLKYVRKYYGYKTIDNIILNIESIIEYRKKHNIEV
jgi:hypothetical protein